jgi:hypothetical protein
MVMCRKRRGTQRAGAVIKECIGEATGIEQDEKAKGTVSQYSDDVARARSYVTQDGTPLHLCRDLSRVSHLGALHFTMLICTSTLLNHLILSRTISFHLTTISWIY